MIDGREPLRRTVPGELGEASEPTPRRFSRLATAAPAAKRMATTRVGMAISLLVLVCVGATLVGSRGANAARKWLHGLPVYQKEFAAIELDPPCPKYIKPGTAGILEKVRKAAKRPESFSLPDVDLDEIATDFKHSPWVSKVERVVASHPNGLRVQLVYREPVARVKSSGGYVDGKNIVLAANEIDFAEAGSLIWIMDGVKPEDAIPLNRLTPGLEHPGANLEPAANLAAFLKQRMNTLEPKDSPGRPAWLHAAGLWVETVDSTMIQWSDPPGDEKPGSPNAFEKWEMYARWVAGPNRKKIDHPRYLIFGKNGLELSPDKAARK